MSLAYCAGATGEHQDWAARCLTMDARRLWAKAKSAHLSEYTSFVPSKPDAVGDLPIDPNELRRAISPCCIHVTDGAFNGLVLEKLIANGIQATAQHDAWLLAERVLDHEGKETSGVEVLRGVIAKVGQEWLESMGSFYALFTKYLGDDSMPMENPDGTEKKNPDGTPFTFGQYAHELKEKWEQRKAEERWPRFWAEEPKTYR